MIRIRGGSQEVILPQKYFKGNNNNYSGDQINQQNFRTNEESVNSTFRLSNKQCATLKMREAANSTMMSEARFARATSNFAD